MNLSRTLTVAGLALTASAMIGTGVAGADPAAGPGILGNSALLNTTCSYDQLHRALATVDPQTARELDAQPTAAATMRQLFALPPAQRRAAVQQWMNQNQSQVNAGRQLAQQHPDQVAHAQSVATQAARTCHQY